MGKTPKILVLDGQSLRLEDIYESRNPEVQVHLTPATEERINQHWKLVCETVEKSFLQCKNIQKQLSLFEQKNTLSEEEKKRYEDLKLDLVEHSIYGVNTGFGQLKTQGVEELGAMKQLQNNIIRSHACGVGPLLPDPIVRMMMVLRLNTLVRAQSGIRLETIHRLLSFINKNVLPEVPSQGSVGASGDLAPLAHMSLLLLGEGPIRYQQKRWVSPPQNSAIAPPEELIQLFQELKMPLHYTLDYKEGLSLTNGTTCMTAIGASAWIEAIQLFKQTVLVSTLTMEALMARTRAFDEVVHRQRPHPGQISVAKMIRTYLKGSEWVNRWPHVHDAYSIRCVPQVLGASLDQLKHIKNILEIELNSTVDDPLFFLPEDLSKFSPFDGNHERIHYEQGHFHGEPVAMAMDLLKIAVAEIANISERRIQHLLDHHHNRGLSGCLLSSKAMQNGAHSGLLIAQYTAAALVSENKVLAHPASVDSIPTSANHEDHVSMGTIAARQALSIVENARKVIAIELMCATQAITLRKQDSLFAQRKQAPKTQEIWEWSQKQFPFLEEDRFLAEDILRTEEALYQQGPDMTQDIDLFETY